MSGADVVRMTRKYKSYNGLEIHNLKYVNGWKKFTYGDITSEHYNSLHRILQFSLERVFPVEEIKM